MGATDAVMAHREEKGPAQIHSFLRLCFSPYQHRTNPQERERLRVLQHRGAAPGVCALRRPAAAQVCVVCVQLLR